MLYLTLLGSLAQLVRAPALQAGGHRFESYNSHQSKVTHVTFFYFSTLKQSPKHIVIGREES